MYLKPQPFVNKRHNLIIGLLVFLGTLLVYYLTMARSLSFWDAGEYITCSSILGVPHPPGNPFYILLGRFFTILGFSIPHPQIINFLSSLFSALAVMFTYFFTVKFITMWLENQKEAYIAYIGGFIAATYTAFSFTFWTNAIEAEVYAGLAFILNLVWVVGAIIFFIVMLIYLSSVALSTPGEAFDLIDSANKIQPKINSVAGFIYFISFLVFLIGYFKNKNKTPQ